MASKNLVSNLKVITSGNTPTTSQLANGEFAFGIVDGVARLFGNVGGTIYEFSLVRSVADKTGNVTLVKGDVGLSDVDNTSDMDKPVSTAQAEAISAKYTKPVGGIPESDLSEEVQNKLDSIGLGAVNLLQSSVTANRQAGETYGDMVNLGYALGLEEGKEYTVKYKFNGADIVATAKYEAVAEGTIEGATLALCQSISAEGQTMKMPMLLGVQNYNASLEEYQSAALDYGFLYIVDKHQITGDAIYTADENNSSVYLRALQSANAQNAVSVEITAIEPFAEVVADKAIADGEGNNIVSTYAKQNGNYSDMTVGNADKLDNKAAEEYALASDIPDVSNFAEKTGTYPNMSVGNATNIIPDSNGAVNPNGRGSGTVGGGSTALGGNASASGKRSTALGSNASASGLSSIALGDSASAIGALSTALGAGASLDALSGNTIKLGSDSLSALHCKVNLTVTSDKRDKTDIESITDALAFIERLSPVTFVSNDRVNYILDEDKKGETFRKYGMCEYDRVAHAAGTKKGERRRCGLLAQEVIAAMQTVYGTDNYANIVNDNFHDLAEKPSDVENKYTLAYANLVPFLIGAIQELNMKIKSLEGK